MANDSKKSVRFFVLLSRQFSLFATTFGTHRGQWQNAGFLALLSWPSF